MRSYIELIETWEQFLQKQPKGSLEDFAQWILERPTSASLTMAEDAAAVYEMSYEAEQQATYGYSSANAKAPYLLWRMSKILKVYSKPVFELEGLKSQDEFAILSYVHMVGECPKKEAIEAHLIDGSTGIDMIKRLIKRGFLTDRISPQDRRARLVQLSEEGEKLLKRVYQRMLGVPEVLVNMSQEEQATFIQQLEQLDHTHTRRLQKNTNKK